MTMLEKKPVLDTDLPPINRTEANFWKAKYLEALIELAKANKGLRRLSRNRNKMSVKAGKEQAV